jgi:FAD/FMN-containing dehydrogenase
MTGVRVDPAQRTARIEAGARWQQVIEAAAPHGLAPLSGSSPELGAVSYLLGGGLGLLARRFGYAADHVRAFEVVTADGRLRRVTATADPDLFWALRGAGQNFGVVTAMEIDLVEVTAVYGGGLYFDTALIPDVLRAWLDWTGSVPEELTSSVAVIPVPDLPVVPEPLRGRQVAHVRIAYVGDAGSGHELVAPLRAVGERLIDSVGELPYTRSGRICDDPTEPHAYRGTAVLLSHVDEPGVLDLAGARELPCVVQINHLGGALARPPAVANCVGHRDAAYLLRVLSPLGSAPAASAAELHERHLAALGPSVLGRSINFLFGEHTPEQVRSAYEEADYQRLAGLKARFDPANLFRLNHNIGI